MLRGDRPSPDPDPASTPLADLVGGTPLVRLRRLEAGLGGGELWAKLEWYNPSGSVKDRAALGIVRAALADGRLGAGRRLLDATSGNTGISYAMLGAAFGFGVTLVLPANASVERKKILATYGADLILTDAMQGMDLAIATARTLCEREPQRWFYADQYSNDDNWRAHFDGTAVELLAQTDRRLTHFVAGLGTSGTFVGTTRRLRRERPGVRCIAFIPDSPYHGLEGLKHMPTAQVPAIYDASLADAVLEVSTEVAEEMVLRLAREEGLFAGMSSGAALVATRRVMRRDGPGVYVTVLPDGGMKYLSQPLFALDAEFERRGEGPGVSGMIELGAGVLDAIRAHGEAEYPEECCGVLLGRVDGERRAIVLAAPLRNARADERRRRFLITAEDYRGAEAEAARRDLELVGFYHSHPDHPARPSEYDREHALPWHSYLVLAVAAGRAAECTSWILAADRSRFEPEVLA